MPNETEGSHLRFEIPYHQATIQGTRYQLGYGIAWSKTENRMRDEIEMVCICYLFHIGIETNTHNRIFVSFE